MKSINPATEECIGEYPETGPEEVAKKIESAVRAYESWRIISWENRSELMMRAGRILRENRGRYGRLMTLEMGKTLASAEAEADKCAWVCEFYAEQARSYLAPERIGTDAEESHVRYDPLGPVLAVMPWNFPFWQVFRFAAPALMAGNVGLLKHASNVTGCALAIEEVFTRAGFPDGCFQSLLIPSSQVAEVIRHPGIQAATLTGSEPAGASVASLAGRMLKKTVMELGGSDPFLVLRDADVPWAARWAAVARCINNGQSCIAAKRFIVEREIADRFEKCMVEEMEKLAVGDPLNRETDVGPLARGDLRDELHGQVVRSVREGAVLKTGGRPVGDRGYYYAPTVLSGVEPGMAAFDEETFGPVAAVVRADDADHAVALANRSEFGLGASLWTGNMERGLELAPRIEAGAVFVNGIVKSDPRLPFGGVKRSGYGRELGAFGIREFVNIKTVWAGHHGS